MSGVAAYLLDTNVLSEMRKPRANPKVVAFMESCDPDRLFVSVLTIGELREGAARKRRKDPVAGKVLTAWVNGLEHSYRQNILGVDLATAHLWGEWSAGRTRPVVDTLLAATAAHHNLTLVTRNLRDVSGLPVKVLNPWQDE